MFWDLDLLLCHTTVNKPDNQRSRDQRHNFGSDGWKGFENKNIQEENDEEKYTPGNK